MNKWQEPQEWSTSNDAALGSSVKYEVISSLEDVGGIYLIWKLRCQELCKTL